MIRKITIGSRGSDLALWQAEYVKNQLLHLKIDSEIKIIKTKGDKIQNLSFDKLEGKGFFTKEIEDALLNNSIDLAVHSHKDLETNLPKGLVIAAVSEREDPSELLLIRKERIDRSKLWCLKDKAVVGTSSSRRKSLLQLFNGDVVLKDLRGNVPTRIQKLRNGEYDAIIIAKAGISRLQLDVSDLHCEVLPIKWFIPAPAQGVLGLQVRESDIDLTRTLQSLNAENVQKNIEFERKVLNLMQGGCQLPLGVYCETDSNGIKTWVSFSSSAKEIPRRLYKENCTPEQIVDLLQAKSKKELQIFITRELKEDSLFYKSIRNIGNTVVGKSLIEITQVECKQPLITDWIFFTSLNSVSSYLDQLVIAEATKIGVMGKSTAIELLKKGITVDFIGNGTPDIVALEFAKKVKKTTVLFPVSDKGIKTIQNKIPNDQVVELMTYKTNPLPLSLQKYDVLVFTSPSNVDSFFISNSISNEKVIAIGPTTKQALINYSVSEIHVSWESSELALADTVQSII